MHKPQWIFFIFFFFVFTSVKADPWQPADKDISLGHFPTKLVSDLSNLFIPENILPVVVGGTATAIDWTTFDSQDSLAHTLDTLNVEPLFDFGNFYGQGWVEGGGALGSWILGALTNDKRLGSFGRDTAEALVMATITVTGLKYAVDRTRPNGSPYSFPSGHSITAFCIAPVVNKYWGWQAGIPVYLLGVITDGARIEDRWHYLSDVIAGATLGIVIGNAVVYSPKNISVSAMPGGLEATWKFN